MAEIPEAIERLKALGDEVAAMKEKMRETAQGVLADGTRAIFDEYGDIIASFGWLQYTPFFNDGDPCEFGMHELAIIAKEDLLAAAEEDGIDLETADDYEISSLIRDRDWVYEGSDAFSSYRGKIRKFDYRDKPNPDFDQRYADAKDACMAIYEICAADGQQVAKDIFGDHVRVIFTPSGVDTEDYDHD